MGETQKTLVVLVDLSAIAVPIYLTSTRHPDPNHTAIQTVRRVYGLAATYKHLAICCDSTKSFRRTLDPSYKANRAKDPALRYQIDIAISILQQDKFPCWQAEGYEADDVIASATAEALKRGLRVLIVGVDKDLFQLVGPDVRILDPRDDSVIDEETIARKLGITPQQVVDYLSLVGDAADNITGIPGIGPARAAKLLARVGSLDALYTQLHTRGPASLGLPLQMVQALKAFEPRRDTVRSLVSLRTDVIVPFEDVLAERVPLGATLTDFAEVTMDEPLPLIGSDHDITLQETAPADQTPVPETAVDTSAQTSQTTSATTSETIGQHGVSTPADSKRPDVKVSEPEVLAVEPVGWERMLDPRSLREAKALAVDMYNSRMFAGYGSPQAVLSTIMTGRELGLPAMASLRGIYNIEGKHALSASLMVALVLRSGLAEYFRPVEISDRSVTFETLRKGPNQKPITLTHTIEMAQRAGLVKPDSGWVKVPTDMLVARCSARLARLVYPDLLFGLYTPEELEELRGTTK
jgi:5'-3' exonuclease